jgi:choice-of-anchor A domain-containing protein
MGLDYRTSTVHGYTDTDTGAGPAGPWSLVRGAALAVHPWFKLESHHRCSGPAEVVTLVVPTGGTKMMFRTWSSSYRMIGLGTVLMAATVAVAAPPLSGAIFTTTATGDVVNENVHYGAKEEVYLDGGPGPNAPSTAAGLPEGDYYFQVTDPSGKDLLSSDHISCRSFHVNEYGVINEYYTTGSNYTKVETKSKGKTTYSWVASACTGHATGIDLDYGGAPENAITVQLFPYDDTPNNGGVYKVWIIPTTDYLENVGEIIDPVVDCAGSSTCNVNGEDWSGGYFHGFIGSDSKTDNFKVTKKGKPCEAPTITVQKFIDADADGVWDSNEFESTWKVFTTDNLGIEDAEYTTFVKAAPEAGTYTFREELPPGYVQTALIVDGVSKAIADTASISIAGTCGETHTVTFGNDEVPPDDTCPTTDGGLGGATPYNVVVFGDYVGTSTDVEGKTAVGGSAVFTNMGLGSVLTPFAGDVLSVKGTLTATSGQVYGGDARVGGTCSTSTFNILNGALTCNDPTTFDAGTLEGEMMDLAGYLNTIPANGDVFTTSWGDVALVGYDPVQNVFDLDLDAVETGFSVWVTLITGFTIDIPAGSTAIVNVRGNTGIFMQTGSFNLVGATANDVLYNFGTAVALDIQSVGVKGSVLAPWADVDFDSAHIDGTLVVAGLTGTGESHQYLFDQDICIP